MALEIIHGQELEDIMQENDIELGKGQLAIGVKVPTSVKTPVSYIDGLRKYKDIYNDPYKQMEVANKLYKFHPLIGNAVDVLIDFAVTDGGFEPTGNKKLDEVLHYWTRNINRDNTNTEPGIYCLSEEIALEWFTSGNAFPYAKWQNVSITDDSKNQFKMPIGINLMNPQSIEIPSGPIAFGQEVIYLKYDSGLIEKIRRDGRTDPEAALIKQAIPRSVINAIVSKKRNAFASGIRLNPKYITHLKRRAKGYQAWGVPYLSRVFEDAALMEKLRELDESVATGLTQLITIFKIGTEEHPAGPARLRAFANLLHNPKATTTLVWAHDVEILQVGPDGKILQYKDKYKDIKENMLIALGIPPVLMSLGGKGDEWVSILSLVERLSSWRNIMSQWYERKAKEIALHNDIKVPNDIHFKWARMNLVDESAIKNLVLAFYDRGLISIDTALRDAGYKLDIEKHNKKTESPFKEDFLPPELPFSGKDSKVDKKRPEGSDVSQTVKPKSTKTETTVNLKPQTKKSKPKPPGKDNKGN